jgi:hypothetical protein
MRLGKRKASTSAFTGVDGIYSPLNSIRHQSYVTTERSSHKSCLAVCKLELKGMYSKSGLFALSSNGSAISTQSSISSARSSIGSFLALVYLSLNPSTSHALISLLLQLASLCTFSSVLTILSFDPFSPSCPFSCYNFSSALLPLSYLSLASPYHCHPSYFLRAHISSPPPFSIPTLLLPLHKQPSIHTALHPSLPPSRSLTPCPTYAPLKT